MDEAYLDRLAKLAREVHPVVVSDLLCCTRFGAYSSDDLLLLQITGDAVVATDSEPVPRDARMAIINQGGVL